MPFPNVDAIVDILTDLGKAVGSEQTPDNVIRFVESVLGPPRELLAAFHLGIVTSDEVALAILDRFHTEALGGTEGALDNLEAWNYAHKRMEAAVSRLTE